MSSLINSTRKYFFCCSIITVCNCVNYAASESGVYHCGTAVCDTEGFLVSAMLHSTQHKNNINMYIENEWIKPCVNPKLILGVFCFLSWLA